MDLTLQMLIKVKNLYKIFGSKPQSVLAKVQEGVSKNEILKKTKHTVGLDNISLDIKKGETFVVMGLSGSGKSTLIRCLNRLIEPTAGEVLIEGHNILNLSKQQVQQLRREKMSMVFQRFALFPHKNVLQNVAYGLNVQGISVEQQQKQALYWIETVGLKGYENSRPRQLSGGMQQRVGLARALCTNPEILLMDEAFSALDPLIRREMQDELIKLQQELQKTIVFITHDLDEALRLGDRVAILKDGQLVQLGTPEEILRGPANNYVADFIRDVNRAKVLTSQSVMHKATVIYLSDSSETALEAMRKQGTEIAFVLNNSGQCTGVVTLELAQNQPNLADALQEGTPSTVDSDTTIEDILPLSSASSLPIAVVNKQNKIIGGITRQAVLKALVG